MNSQMNSVSDAGLTLGFHKNSHELPSGCDVKFILSKALIHLNIEDVHFLKGQIINSDQLEACS